MFFTTCKQLGKGNDLKSCQEFCLSTYSWRTKYFFSLEWFTDLKWTTHVCYFALRKMIHNNWSLHTLHIAQSLKNLDISQKLLESEWLCVFAYLHRANSFFAGKPKVSSTLSLYTTPSTIIVHRQTHSLSSITISNPPSQSTDKHEDSVVGGDPDGDLCNGWCAVWRRLWLAWM